MTTPGRALVVGKFYPLHLGHCAVVRRAVDVASRVTVVVMASAAETIPLDSRVAWLASEHVDEPVDVVGVRCDAPVDLYDDTVWSAQVAAIRVAAHAVDPDPIDVVVSGEAYGAELAERLGADHVLVQRDPPWLSASAIRADPIRLWSSLSVSAQRGLTTTVAVVGMPILADALMTRFSETAAVVVTSSAHSGDIPVTDLAFVADEREAERMLAANRSWVLLAGRGERELQLAIRTVEGLAASRLRFGDPLRGPGFGD